MEGQVKNGDTVTIHYTGTLSDGSVFDTTKDREPFEFVAGSDNVIPGISSGVLGMSEGEKKTVNIPPEEAYGPHDPAKLLTVESSRLPQGVGVGDVLTDTENRRWRIHQIEGEKAVVDGNHQLAGQTLTFDVEVVSIR
ncbi:MAG: peptidylprolyl isomerase [Leptospirillia bacterium]